MPDVLELVLVLGPLSKPRHLSSSVASWGAWELPSHACSVKGPRRAGRPQVWHRGESYEGHAEVWTGARELTGMARDACHHPRACRRRGRTVASAREPGGGRLMPLFSPVLICLGFTRPAAEGRESLWLLYKSRPLWGARKGEEGWRARFPERGWREEVL